MLAIQPNLPGAAIKLDENVIPTEAQPKAVDQSFARQMQQVMHAELSGIDQPPDAYLLTANSAWPLADAILGYYDASTLAAQPRLAPIHAKRSQALRYWERQRFNDDDNVEINRLRSFVTQHRHICVVEQIVSGGTTLAYAGRLLLGAGARQVSAIRGDWYEDADISDNDIKDLTSPHKSFLTALGAKAYEGSSTYAKHFANKDI